MVLEAKTGQPEEEKWVAFVGAAFKAANLPDVPEDQLETGTYTNRQIADKFRSNPARLLGILMDLPGGNDASKRAILSFVVDMVDEEQPSST